MNILDLISLDSIAVNASPKSQQEAIELCLDLHVKAGIIVDVEQFRKDLMLRESHSSTFVGNFVSIPHAKSSGVSKPAISIAVVPNGVEWGETDSIAKLVVMIASPQDGGDVHLEALSNVMAVLMHKKVCDELVASSTPSQLVDTLLQAQSNLLSELRDAHGGLGDKYILAVTGCPTGIAHTYMAAESLQNKAKEMGINIKVETNGSGGAKNKLTSDEIAGATAILICADVGVDMARFDGKPLVNTKVADGIHKPQELIQRVLNGNVPVYHHSSAKSNDSETHASANLGRQIYQHLMRGVSYMLPFVIAGGIAIALAFLFDDYNKGSSSFGSNTPFAAWFMNVGGLAFSFMLPVLAGFIAYSIADRPGLVMGFVGGALASSGLTFNMDQSTWVSAGFLGAILAGFAAGYLMLGMKKLADEYLPNSLEGIKPILIYPLVGLILIGLVMSSINPIMGAINTGLNNMLDSIGGTSGVVLGLILGGMMAIDMGGPINKAAYVFGTASIASGNLGIMASVMAGGMVPPLIIALSTTIAKNKFTAQEQKSGPVNYIMGLCFITEGAIPYAASDPGRVLPSCIVGSAIAGALTYAFNVTLPAPHGGIFVFPVVGNWGLYLLAIAIGSLVGALMLILLKQKVPESNN